MATPSVLAFDAEGRAVDFDVWVDDLQLFLQCDRADGLSLFDLTSGASLAPTADADATVGSQWATRDAAARLAVRRHLPTSEHAHLSQYKSAQSLYDAVVARYSSPATAALSRLMLPYLFPELAAFPTVADLITHLRTSDTRYRAALPAEFCAKNLTLPPPPPCTSLSTKSVDLLEKALLAAEKSIVAIGASRGDPRTPIFEGCSPSPLLPSIASAAAADLVGLESVGAASTPSGRRRSGKGKGEGALEELAGAVEEAVEAVEGVGVAVGVVAGVEVSVAAVEAEAAAAAVAVGAEVAEVAAVEEAVAEEVELAGVALRRGSAPVVVSASTSSSSSSTLVTSPPLSSSVSGTLHASGVGVLVRAPTSYAPATAQFPEAIEIPRWGELPRAEVAVFDLDFDAILAAMYAVTISDEGDCYRCFPPDPGIETAALGTGEAAALGASEAAALGARASAPSGAGESALSGCGGSPVHSCESRVTHCKDARTGRHLATFTRRPGSSMYTLTTVSPPVTASGQVAASRQVFAAASRSGPESAPCLCRLLSHETLLWHHLLGHPSLLRLRGMASRVLVSGLPRSLPPLPPGLGPTCVPCVEGRQRAAPHSSQFPLIEAPLQTLHMDVWGSGGEFSSGLLRAYCRARSIRQTFTLPHSPQQNGIAERRIGMVMDVARMSMMHAAAPHFLRPFAVRYAAHQINLHPKVSMLETSPALLWTGKVGDASAFRVGGSRAFVRDLSADKLSPRATPYVFLGSPPDAPGWQFYHPTTRRVLSSQDITFDESVHYYRLFPYRTPSFPPPPLFLVPGPPPVEPLPPQGPAPSSVSQVDAVEPVKVTSDFGAAEGAEPGGADSGGAERVGAAPGGAEPAGFTTRGAEPRGTATGGAEPGGTATGGAEPGGATHGGSERGGVEPGGAEPEGVGPTRVAFGGAGLGGSLGASRAAGAGGSPAAEGAGAAGPGGARTGSTGAAGPAGTIGAGAADGVGAEAIAVGYGDGPTGGATGAAGGTGGGGAARAGAAAGGTGAVLAVSGVAVRPRPYFVPLLQQVLGLPPSTCPPPPLECPQPVVSKLHLHPSSPLPAPSPYTSPTRGLAQRREPASRPTSPVHAARTSGRGSRQRPPPIPGTHRMSLRPSTAPLRAPLPSPPQSSLPALADPESDSVRATSPTVTRLLATVVTNPSFESIAASALVAELVDFAARCRLDYATSLVAESESAEAIKGPYSSQWQAAMDAEMASWKSTGTYVDEVPPRGANIVRGMWIFRMKRPPGSPPVFKARYVARGFSQRQGVDYFQTFSPTPKMTTLRVLLHIAAHRDYELHSLDFLAGQPARGDLAAPPTWIHWVFSSKHPVEPPAASLRSSPGTA
ncbi:unnamed protein product [Closterium sp. NIES-65]|nr:unnamed protein product [Closterium sp. NIES-65]